MLNVSSSFSHTTATTHNDTAAYSIHIATQQRNDYSSNRNSTHAIKNTYLAGDPEITIHPLCRASIPRVCTLQRFYVYARIFYILCAFVTYNKTLCYVTDITELNSVDS